jgi:HlyD family secretion protein
VRSVEPGGFAKVSALGVEERRTRVRIALDDASRQVAWSGALGDGFQLQAEFIVWQHPSVSRVPLAALFRDGDAWAVYAVQQGRARLRHVRIGHTGQEYAQVLSGLDEGVQVVLYPGSGLRQDMRVAPRGR